MIIVRLLGGMGNQMFQYAIGRRLALENDVPLRLDPRLLLDRSPGRHAVNRSFDLDIFNIDFQHACLAETLPYSAWGLPRPLRFLAKATWLSKETRQLVEQSFGFNNHVLKCGPQAYLAGLWQSYKYFSPIQLQILRDFSIVCELSAASTQLSSELRSCRSVCVNVRRTDFVSVPSTQAVMGFVGLDYYRRAVDYVRNQYPAAKFYIFSDEPEWCWKHLSFIPNATVVGHEHAGHKFATYFQLMQRCSMFIIPNSTFAWWTAWLSESCNKQVIAPKRWFRDPSIDVQDLLPPDWIQL